MLNNITVHIAGENAFILYFSKQGDGQVNADTSSQVQQAEQLIRQAMKLDSSIGIIDLVP